MFTNGTDVLGVTTTLLWFIVLGIDVSLVDISLPMMVFRFSGLPSQMISEMHRTGWYLSEGICRVRQNIA